MEGLVLALALMASQKLSFLGAIGETLEVWEAICGVATPSEEVGCSAMAVEVACGSSSVC